ncbi:terpene synthase family protein [Dactylosporangium sp. NPDC005555]|uniref:terpene synthase family protein n=1 Tax=Dactylosporangium sp. NPDC005555 TaxID=3154889 RepID=UPI0033BA58C4
MEAPRDVVRHPDDRAANTTAAEIGADLWRWADTHGARPDRGLARRLAEVVTTIAPDLPIAGATVAARYSLWTFLVDDALDDVTVDPVALTELAGRLTTLVRTTAATSAPAPMLDAMLAELLAELRLANAPTLLARFTDALCDAIDAGVEHTLRAQRIQQGHAGAPTVVDYLAVAESHVNYRSFAYLLLILAEAPPAAVPSPRVDKALVAASRAIRIANDLASVDRDRAAGRLNVLLLRQVDAAGIAAFERRIDRYVRLHDDLLRDAAEAGVLRRSLHVAVAVYRVTDLR